MKIFYTSFNTWNHLDNKNEYQFFAISYTIPKYFTGLKYLKLTPSKTLFLDTHKNGYEPKHFFKQYANEICRFSRTEIFNDLTQLSDNKIPCLIGWEQFKILGECQFCIAWLFKISLQDALTFELTQNLQVEDTIFFNL